MNEKTTELKTIVTKFAESGWNVIATPAKAWLENKGCKEEFISAIEKASKECGTCGCEYDSLYKKFLNMKESL